MSDAGASFLPSAAGAPVPSPGEAGVSSSKTSFQGVLDRLRQGDAEAAEQVFMRYGDRLLRLSDGRIGHELRPKIDGDDVAQSAFRTFFRRSAGGEFELAGWDDLWAVLAAIAVRKSAMQARRFRAARRDVRREVGDPKTGGAGEVEEALRRAATPADALQLAETVEALLRPMGEEDRTIIALALEGCPVLEISARTGRTERTVYRVLARARHRLGQGLAAES